MPADYLAKYVLWIAKEVQGEVAGLCETWTMRMATAFPELTRVWGIVLRTDMPPSKSVDHLSGHWWLFTPDGEIVDPTAKQFPWPFFYLPYDKVHGFLLMERYLELHSVEGYAP